MKSWTSDLTGAVYDICLRLICCLKFLNCEFVSSVLFFPFLENTIFSSCYSYHYTLRGRANCPCLGTQEGLYSTLDLCESCEYNSQSICQLIDCASDTKSRLYGGDGL